MRHRSGAPAMTRLLEFLALIFGGSALCAVVGVLAS